MDELAVKLQLDPVELRLKNLTLNNPMSGKPYSSCHLEECYRTGSRRSSAGSKRHPKTGCHG